MTRLGVALATASLLAAGCAAKPGPPPVEEFDTVATAPQQDAAAPDTPATPGEELDIGIDPVRGGFNPHLVADATPFVQSMAALVFPSCFVDGAMNSDLLVSAETVDDPSAPLHVRYEIATNAQWSDGTPITGADFRYVWQSVVSTPGALDRPAYAAIDDIVVTGAGKTVDVIFSRPLASWQRLFSNLLPSHIFLTGTEGFDRVLATTVPVSGWHYQVVSVDRQQGEIRLARNDRYWGRSPARVERLVFREVSDTHILTEMMRRRQLVYADITPGETTAESLSLVPSLDVERRIYPQRLDLVFSTHGPVLYTPERRARFASLVDARQVATLALQRHATLGLPAPSEFPDVPNHTQSDLPDDDTIVIGVDATDDTAVSAARTVADLAEAKGVTVRVRLTTTAKLYGTLMPEGLVDAIITTTRTEPAPVELAARYMCEFAVSGVCGTDVDAVLGRYLRGTATEEEARAATTRVENDLVLTLPLAYDVRLDVAYPAMVGLSGRVANWPLDTYGGRLASAATWRRNP